MRSLNPRIGAVFPWPTYDQEAASDMEIISCIRDAARLETRVVVRGLVGSLKNPSLGGIPSFEPFFSGSDQYIFLESRVCEGVDFVLSIGRW